MWRLVRAGVGKSELAKTLASYYFGSEEAMVRLDMSEFMERHTVSKLIGSPPGAGPSFDCTFGAVDSLLLPELIVFAAAVRCSLDGHCCYNLWTYVHIAQPSPLANLAHFTRFAWPVGLALLEKQWVWGLWPAKSISCAWRSLGNLMAWTGS